MKRIIFTLLFLLPVLCFAGEIVSIKVQPGQLERIASELNRVVGLDINKKDAIKLSGEINVTDLHYIESLKELRYLDLREVTSSDPINEFLDWEKIEEILLPSNNFTINMSRVNISNARHIGMPFTMVIDNQTKANKITIYDGNANNGLVINYNGSVIKNIVSIENKSVCTVDTLVTLCSDNRLFQNLTEKKYHNQVFWKYRPQYIVQNNNLFQFVKKNWVYCQKKYNLDYNDYILPNRTLWFEKYITIDSEALLIAEKARIEVAEKAKKEEKKREEQERARLEAARRDSAKQMEMQKRLVQVKDKAPAYVKAVDLGLPSGTLWANVNIGATVPEGSGNYYAWGETGTKSTYNSKTYISNKKDADGFETWQDLGSVICGTKYDVARMNWGGTWQLPTDWQMQELVDKCTWEATTKNGVPGYKITGSNGNWIFLPAAGGKLDNELGGKGMQCFYWTGSAGKCNHKGCAAYLYASDSSIKIQSHALFEDMVYTGRSVRPVCSK